MILKEYSNHLDDMYKNIEGYNPNKKHRRIIIFDDMISGMLSNKILNHVVTDLFIGRKKLNISHFPSFHYTITKSRFAVAKNIRLKFYTLIY